MDETTLPDGVEAQLREISTRVEIAKLRNSPDVGTLHSVFVQPRPAEADLAVRRLLHILRGCERFARAHLHVAAVGDEASGDSHTTIPLDGGIAENAAVGAINRSVDAAIGGVLLLPHVVRLLEADAAGLVEAALRIRLLEDGRRFVAVITDTNDALVRLSETHPGFLPCFALMWDFRRPG